MYLAQTFLKSINKIDEVNSISILTKLNIQIFKNEKDDINDAASGTKYLIYLKNLFYFLNVT